MNWVAACLWGHRAVYRQVPAAGSSSAASTPDNGAPRRGSLRTFDLSMGEWLDACDESSWIGTPPPPTPWADGAWGPWEDNRAWWNYPQAEARAYRNQRFLPVLVVGAVPAGGLHVRWPRGALRCRLGSPDIVYNATGRCLGNSAPKRRRPAPKHPEAHGVGCGRVGARGP